MFNLEYIRHGKRFFALQVPVYYYVKTEGSLCAQGRSISKTIQMKLTVFEYYNQFYKTVLDEDEYEKRRLKIYRFLIDAAQDGTAPPLPGTARLGRERVHVSLCALEGEGLLFDVFRERKLLDHYLESAALKHDISLAEARLALYLSRCDSGTRAELADFTGLSRSALAMLLKRLAGRELVTVSESRASRGREKVAAVTFSASAASLLDDLEAVWRDFETARLAGFSETERAQYDWLSEKIRKNIRNVLE